MARLAEPAWVIEARKYIGQKEIKGLKHNPFIVGIWPAIGITWFLDDETPWCGGFLAYVMKRVGLKWPKKPAAALSWGTFGTKLSRPAVGAIAVKTRKGGGHVTIVVGRDPHGNLLCLGANQNDEVNISAYRPDAFFTFRWPTGNVPLEERYNLPVYATAGKAVTSEQ